ncbi:Rieske (2Fe-2S) protein [Streptomyces sp. TP-A0874]|uniref:Rieske (2Fe-2S) protein n=1 Tax=Streptomyces sp. TP-A0874 TaxID=549819 RepID=UPI000852CE71|nr:Rieske (2Fe-2S) protein [Streptomyces sp. TP-A0874]
MPDRPAPRRTVLCSAALAGVAGLTGAAISGCAPETGSDGAGGGRRAASPTAPVELGEAEDVPVGGAKLYAEARILVSRPAADEYRAFSALCTHRGCVLSAVKVAEAVCGCHGSRFAVDTGKVLAGPAVEELPRVPVRVDSGKLVAG